MVELCELGDLVHKIFHLSGNDGCVGACVCEAEVRNSFFLSVGHLHQVTGHIVVTIFDYLELFHLHLLS